jgi:Asp-tRNA(Asn)/Glu-tRNA(Gln) amidotransferase A subunit family amidase
MYIPIKVVFSILLCAGLFACAGQQSDRVDIGLSENELRALSALEVTTLIKSKRITATELVQALLSNAKKYKHLNAYITLDENRALAEAAIVDKGVRAGKASGRLLGVPLIIKDNIEVANLPLTIGTPSMQAIVPGQHAAIVQLLVDEGAIILGKANMHELAVGVTSINMHFGAVGNPYDKDFFAGGSSGGTATAVASRAATAGLGTDTGGSVRIPAALTGIVALRPSTGRYPKTGVVPISSSRDIVGPMARTISDLILLDAVIRSVEADYRAADMTSVRLGIPRGYFFEKLEPGVRSLVEQSLLEIVAAGVELIEVDIAIPEDIEGEIGFPLVSYEIREELPAYLNSLTGGQVDFSDLVSAIAAPDVKAIFETLFLGAESTSAEQYKQVKEIMLPKFQAVYADYFEENKIDAMIFPTTPLTTKRIDDIKKTLELNDASISTFKTLSRNTAPGSVAGLPGLTLPIGLSPTDGLPVGIAIDGPVNSDERLLSIALALEKILAPMPAPDLK